MESVPLLLVIDDDPLTLDCFRFLFRPEQATVLTAATAAEGLQLFEARRCDVVILDIRLPDQSGLSTFQKIHRLDARASVILMTGHGTAETAIEAMRLGAFEYIVKPLDPAGLRELCMRAVEVSRFMRVPARLPEAGAQESGSDLLIGNCPEMQEVYKAIGRIAPQDVTVLILGESGTGKELVARAVYHYSKRAAGPFLAINCAAIPEALLESELFGHEKGAFTGAERKRIGKFEQCDGGTLFLDEIGDMTPLMQTKILRVLQDGQFERVGGNETVQTNVRILAATNRDLRAMVAANTFRGDLYYRLNVCSIRLPPLRNRGDDIPLLASHFVTRFSRELGKTLHNLSPEAMAILTGHAWPGNVRELQSAIKQALLQTQGPILGAESLPTLLSQGKERPAQDSSPLEGFPGLTHFVAERIAAGTTNLYSEVQNATDRLLFLQVLQSTGNNLSQGTRILGISRTTLRSKLAALGLAIERLAALEATDCETRE